MTTKISALIDKLKQQLKLIYHDVNIDMSYHQLAHDLVSCMMLTEEGIEEPAPYTNHWSQKDTILITYGDSVMKDEEAPLQTLRHFVTEYLGDSVSSVHILPFFPYSSDDGFSVIDYSSVNEALGDWQDIEALGNDYKIMADLVINHCSSRSQWFENFQQCKGPGKDYFFTAKTDEDLSQVVRPRTSPLLKEIDTREGRKYVWCTFSHDQVDFDFSNPEVLKAFASIIRYYLDKGISIFRLDAVAFLWKVPGTSCINLPQTHEIIRLLRTLIEHVRPDAVVITETNIPNSQNLTYFGNANEAHCIYNFSLPPLLVNTLITGNCINLKRWLMSMPPAQNGTCYFNFIASHDGIGLRPAEGLLSEKELETLIATMSEFGGQISWRASDDGDQKAYEINIALFDALQGTTKGKDGLGLERFICAHVIMLGLEGIPGIYIHSMLGTRNDYEKLAHTHHNRSINRHRWDYQQLQMLLDDPYGIHNVVLTRMKHVVEIRQKQKAFHPNATQFSLHLGAELFGFWRQSIDRQQSIFCVSNITDQPQKLALGELNLIATDHWHDLLSGKRLMDCLSEWVLQPYQTVWITNV